MKRIRLAALAVALTVIPFGLVACGGDDDEASAPATTASETDTASSEAAVSTTSPATDLRVTLDRLLGEHALLAMFATQKGLAGEKDFDAIAGALDANSVDLADAIGSVYGESARAEFLDGDLKWRPHIGFFVDYTVGLAKKDEAAQQEAVGNLMGYVEAFSKFLAEATELPQADLRAAIEAHVSQLKGQIDAYAGGKFPAAYENVREAYHHMFMTGDTLAGGIVDQKPDMFPTGDATPSAADLRVTLGRLLGEHAILAMTATQKGFSGAKDFDAIAKALDANSVDLADAIGSVYGDDARTQFLDGDLLWRDHIGFFVDYTVGLAKKDEAAQQEAVGNLNGYVEAFSSFLADATGAPKADLRTAVESHVMELKAQIDAYAGGEYANAYEAYREAYQHMYMTGDTLAAAIAAQSPEKFSS